MKAIELCYMIINYLCIALFQTPNHPLLGLQLFTLADLMKEAELPEAHEVYIWAKEVIAYNILVITNYNINTNNYYLLYLDFKYFAWRKS